MSIVVIASAALLIAHATGCQSELIFVECVYCVCVHVGTGYIHVHEKGIFVAFLMAHMPQHDAEKICGYIAFQELQVYILFFSFLDTYMCSCYTYIHTYIHSPISMDR
jgi:hypothetical protein